MLQKNPKFESFLIAEDELNQELGCIVKIIHRTLFRIQKVGIKLTFPNNT